MTNLCTLFDSNYLSRGLALYNSIQKVSTVFHLYVVAFDKGCYDYLQNANLPSLTVISLDDFEDNALLEVKSFRSAAEYCWTCTPSVILYCLETYNLPSCTYVDADMIFFDDPQLLLDEMGSDSVLICEHRYTKDYDVSVTHGIYCVQFVCFKNTEEGLTVLKWWRERCLEWCYARLEDGKFGDQKYLDDWVKRFSGVHVLRHPGGGVAPWNVQQYIFYDSNGKIYLKNRIDNLVFPVVFFHFHGLKFYTNGFVSFCGPIYALHSWVKEIFYNPYIKSLLEIENNLKKQSVSFNVTGAKTERPAMGKVLTEFLRDFGSMIVKGKASPFKLGNYNFKRHYHFYKLDEFK
ncbi:MAG TPA: hypothetical protein VFH08_08200 [Chitinophagaceae bacterium]|nr:hypothetical protein [Chitinophagaceae bacterium]